MNFRKNSVKLNLRANCTMCCVYTTVATFMFQRYYIFSWEARIIWVLCIKHATSITCLDSSHMGCFAVNSSQHFKVSLCFRLKGHGSWRGINNRSPYCKDIYSKFIWCCWFAVLLTTNLGGCGQVLGHLQLLQRLLLDSTH